MAISTREIAASVLLAVTASFVLAPFVAALGYKNSCHREERSDLQLFILPRNQDGYLTLKVRPFFSLRAR